MFYSQLVIGCFNNRLVIKVYQLKAHMQLNSVSFSFD